MGLGFNKDNRFYMQDKMQATRLIEDLKIIVGTEHVSASRSNTEIYSYDASLAKGKPDVVVFPGNTEETAKVVRCAYGAGVSFVPRGFGTNLSGGTVLSAGGLVICFSRLNRILGINPNRRCATVQPGVTNLELQNALAPYGFFYAPDPASQKVATLGGNAGENSGGPRCLKYGVTTNHILGMEFVLPEGNTVHFGSEALDPPGYDMRGAVLGSEGTLGIVTELTVRILPLPETIITMLAVYDEVTEAAQSVSDIIAAGIVPTTLEMMDTLIIQAVEDSCACGYPRDAAAVLIIEVEGPIAGLKDQAEGIREICMKNGCRNIRKAKDSTERNRLWKGRRGAFGAVARLAPNFLVNDCSVPRTKLPEALAKVADIAKKYGFRHGNVFHAGDGNLHPLIFFDSRDRDQMNRVKKAGWEIMEACTDLGGTISGEHGIGIEKIDAMRLVFSEDDFEIQRSLKAAFDPQGLLNPGKVIPDPPIYSQEHALARRRPKEMQEEITDNNNVEKRFVKKIRQTISEKQAVLPLGCGTCKDFGNLTKGPVDCLDSSPLNHIVEFDPPNQVVTVGAGMPLTELQQRLGEYRQWLPVRPPTALGGHSIGGMTALGACGPERMVYGAPRDLLLGLRFISGKGRLISTGGKVVKNVAGYDMTCLLVGSAGTLGFITQLTYRIAMLPERCSTFTGRGTLNNCTAVSSKLITSAIGPAHVTAVPVITNNHDISHGEWRLTAGFEGFSKTIDYQLKKTRTLMEKAGLENDAPDDYKALEGCFATFYSLLEHYAFLICGNFPMDRLWEAVLSLEDIFSGSPIFLDLGCGRVIAALDDLSGENWKKICKASTKSGGHVLLEKAPEAFKKEHDVFGPVRSEWQIMHRIKAELDPYDIFAPGRLPGGR